MLPTDTIGNDLGWNSVLFAVLVLGGLYLFGRFYNQKLEQLGDKTEGFTWLEVVIGVFVTLCGLGLLDLLLPFNAFFLGLLAFAASGTPMALGSWKRYTDLRERFQRLQKALNDDEPAPLAHKRR